MSIYVRFVEINTIHFYFWFILSFFLSLTVSCTSLFFSVTVSLFVFLSASLISFSLFVHSSFDSTFAFNLSRVYYKKHNTLCHLVQSLFLPYLIVYLSPSFLYHCVSVCRSASLLFIFLLCTTC
jgi:hypothetical protein